VAARDGLPRRGSVEYGFGHFPVMIALLAGCSSFFLRLVTICRSFTMESTIFYYVTD
jgi:hypothetical protein